MTRFTERVNSFQIYDDSTFIKIVLSPGGTSLTKMF